jgi:hypothetical protein
MSLKKILITIYKPNAIDKLNGTLDFFVFKDYPEIKEMFSHYGIKATESFIDFKALNVLYNYPKNTTWEVIGVCKSKGWLLSNGKELLNVDSPPSIDIKLSGVYAEEICSILINLDLPIESGACLTRTGELKSIFNNYLENKQLNSQEKKELKLFKNKIINKFVEGQMIATFL